MIESSSITAISPLDGRYQQKLQALALYVSEYGLLRCRLLVEIKWLITLLNQPALCKEKISPSAIKHLEGIYQSFNPQQASEIKAIEKKTNHDVKALEYYLKQKIQGHSELEPHIELIHFSCTSEDINNMAYALMLQDARKEVILPAMQHIIDQLTRLAHEHSNQPMLSRTHGQPASPTTVGKEIANFVSRLRVQYHQLAHIALLAKFNGAVGNFNAHHSAVPELDWPSINQAFVEQFGLNWNAYTTQIEPHDYMAEMFHVLIRFNTILLDLDRDFWGYISLGYFKQKLKEGEIGSSTMPHKVNPIDFENSEGNLGIANALLSHMAEKLPISRWQRDLSDSTVLRNVGVALGHCFLAYQATSQGIEKLALNKTQLDQDLDSNWEVLAEAIQTVMRRHNIPEPYEKLKALTRGKAITQEALRDFIESLNLPEDTKKNLLRLSPADYIGYAAELAKKV